MKILLKSAGKKEQEVLAERVVGQRRGGRRGTRREEKNRTEKIWESTEFSQKITKKLEFLDILRQKKKLSLN